MLVFLTLNFIEHVSWESYSCLKLNWSGRSWTWYEGVRVLTGQGKLEKVREFVWSGKGQGKILFLKVSKNDLGSCRLQIYVIFCVSKYYKKFELMLTGRAKAHGSSCPQAVTHHSTNRAWRRVTLFQPKRATNYATPPTSVTWRRLVNDIDLRSPISRKKSVEPPILAFKVIQGHWIRRQSTASVRFPISN